MYMVVNNQNEIFKKLVYEIFSEFKVVWETGLYGKKYHNKCEVWLCKNGIYDKNIINLKKLTIYLCFPSICSSLPSVHR